MKTLYNRSKIFLTFLGLAISTIVVAQPAPSGGAPSNDLCSGAIAVACSDVVSGTTVGATNTGGTPDIGIGVWYVYSGDNQLVTVGTCTSTSGFDTEIAVFAGDCNNRIDVGSDDDGCLPYSELSFEAWAGLDYYIYVGHWSTTQGVTGDFDLSVTCAALPAPPNDLCADATPLVCGDSFIGNTSSGNATGELSCADGDPGVWYSFVGDGSDYTISLDGSGYDTYLGISTTCGGTCVASNDDISFPSNLASEISGFSTVNGQTYYIYVTSIYGESGTYLLSLTSSACTPPANDLCTNAISIACGDVVTGDNTFATEQISSSGAGVWYTFEGNGQDVTFSTCSTIDDPANLYDTEITLLTGDCSGVQTEIDQDDDGCGTTFGPSTITAFTTAGTTYYLYVASWIAGSSDAGEFELSVTCNCTAAAGTLTADASPVCLDGGSADISATEATASVIPSGYVEAYVLTSNPGLIIEAVNSTPDFTVTEGGDYTIHTLVYSPATLDLSGVVFGTTAAADVLAIVQANNICAALDVVGAPITVEAPDAGTLTADVSPVCLDAGSADISATENAAPVVPTGYSVLYVLTSNPGLIIEDAAATPDFTVTAEGDYIIHTLVYNPLTLDLSGVVFGTTSALDVLPSLVQGGGSICANLDATGAPITVEVCGPANDLCTGAIAIACDDVVFGSTTLATNADELDIVPGAGVWYSLVGDGSFVTLSTDNAGTNYDTRIGYTDGCGNAGIDFDEDGGDIYVSGWTSILSFPTTVGANYYIYVGGYDGTEIGDFELSVSCAFPPSNDDVCNASALVMGSNGPFSNVGATVEAGEAVPGAAASCSDQGGWCSFSLTLENSVWFTFVAPASGNMTVSTDNSDYDTQVAVYSAASCQDLLSGTGVLEGANDDNSGATVFGTSLVNLCGLTAGSTYYVQVDGYNGASGDAMVTLTETTVDASFTYAATGLSVAFTDASTSSSSVTDWAWDFGDGGTEVVASPTHAYAVDGPYTVCLTVTDENGCTSEYCEAIQVTDIPTTIAEAVENGLSVYPNPSNGRFVVEVTGVDADAQIVVLDIAGRQVYTEGVVLNGNFRKNMNLNLSKGTYLLQVATLEGVVTRKIMID
ncbi:MAG: T9SS type A sorting domain-containing protein [Flavobacteriales bacterium]|nr:T9SS type A sorting domain-containing protein [Flavobacteriales bacterium]